MGYPSNLNCLYLETFFSQFVSLTLNDTAVYVYGEIRATLATQGTPIGPNDLLIAESAAILGG